MIPVLLAKLGVWYTQISACIFETDGHLSLKKALSYDTDMHVKLMSFLKNKELKLL